MRTERKVTGRPLSRVVVSPKSVASRNRTREMRDDRPASNQPHHADAYEARRAARSVDRTPPDADHATAGSAGEGARRTDQPPGSWLRPETRRLRQEGVVA